MVDVTNDEGPKRGMSASHMRAFICKDCRREIESLQEEIATLEASGASKNHLKRLHATLRTRMEKSTYNENWAQNLVERGGSRSDRCKEHRQKHRTNIQGLAVAYIDLKTVSEVADRDNPTGPFGGLGPLPTSHDKVEGTSYNLQEVRVGMTDKHVAEMIEKLREKQILILKAGTGTGKSTFAPYRLMDPPPSTLTDVSSGAPFAKLTDLGPIIVTEPRVQAAVGVASFVGEVMSGAGGVGPGYPVGYQVSGDRNHDEACELIYITDGTMINWLREGRLSRIGTVIVDEAHERSTNIDFIMGYLKRELPRYPHLRVIITSATFNTDFYLEYFGGPENANVMVVPPEKTFGYGMPFFPNLDTPEDGEDDVLERWTDSALPLTPNSPRDEQNFIRTHWNTQFAEPLRFPDDVSDETDDGYIEDVWETTRIISGLRFGGKIPTEQWQERMPGETAKLIIKLAQGLDQAGIFGDILGFLPTRRTIEPVCEEIEKALGRVYKDQVFPLLSSLPKDRQRKALARRRKGDPRKIVISTNLAETSLTVEGVRFVVDSGIIAQSEWDPELAKGTIPTRPHSQAGIKQRWGRVGRKAPGWVFPLYTKGQFLELAEDTPPGSTRDNLEGLVMTAKMGGIDDVHSFGWPAAFEPTSVVLDEKAKHAREVFIRELRRADGALRAGGAVDNQGHPTSFGKELVRFQGLGSTASALAILYADRLACVPEVTTVIALLEDTRLIGQRGLLLDDFDWPDDWRLEAAERHRGFASVCEDEAELVLLIAAAWERADPHLHPWQDSTARENWARMWWVNHSVLLEAAKKRQEVLDALAPAMKEEVKRFIEPALINRTRGVLTRAMAAHIFTGSADGTYQPSSTMMISTSAEHLPLDSDQTDPDSDAPANTTAPVAALTTPRVFRAEEDSLFKPLTEHVVALRRRESKLDNRISSLVIAQHWAMNQSDEHQPSSAVDAMRMLIAASKYAPAEAAKNTALQYIESWPVGQRVKLELESMDSIATARTVTPPVPPFPRPKTREERGLDTRSHRTARSRTRSKLALDEYDLGGSLADVKTEIRLDPRRGADDEAAWQADLLEADRETRTLQACGQCFPCRDDRPEDCERQVGPSEPGRREDLVAAWRETASAGTDVSAPLVEVDREYPIDSDGWYVVTGYRRGADGFVVKVSPDWRRGQMSNAGQHPDLKAGDPIEVRVGQRLRHHGGSLRAFDRRDGLGRFILAEARGRYDDEQVRRREIAVSLDRGSTLLLENLVTDAVVKATAVPARAEGTLTITLLELLHQHWSKAQVGRGASNEILDKSRRNQYYERVHTALVESLPNPNGYVTARLLLQDSALGIVHRFAFNVKSKQEQSTAQPEPSNKTGAPREAWQLNTGDPIMVKLRSDRTSLDVSGLSVEKLRNIKSHQAGQITIDGLPNDEDPAQHNRTIPGRPYKNQSRPGTQTAKNGNQASHDDDGDGLAPPGTLVFAKTEKPLSRSAAAALVGLSEEPDWPSEVWSFWARTHHLRVDDRTPFIAGTLTEPSEVRATVHIEETTPLAQQQARITAFTAQHPVYSVVECTVKSLSNQGVFVELDGEIEGFIPTQELSWANRLRHPDQSVNVGGYLQAVLLEVPELPGKPTLSVKLLKPDPFEAFKNRFQPGARVSGTISGRIQHAVFVDLGNDVDGSIHISELDHLHVATAEDFSEVGAAVEVEVVGFDDKARKVDLSRKKTLPHPFDGYKARHKIGDKVRGTVKRTTKSHVYLTHSNGATGVVFVRNLGDFDATDASRVASVGDEITAEIIRFNIEKKLIELSVGALLYREYKARHSVGEKVEGRIVRATPTHVYVIHSNGATGAVFARNLVHGGVDDASSIVSIGEKLTAQIIGFNDDRLQVELSAKAVLPEPYTAFKSTTPVGASVTAVVTAFNDYFAYVTLPGGVSGSIHVSQLSSIRVGKPADVLSKGQQLTAAVIGFDDQRKKVQLSVRQSPSMPAPRKSLGSNPAPAASRAAPTRIQPKPQPRSVVVEGDTVEAAVADACQQLGVPPSSISFEILDQGEKKRLFRSARPACVRVTPR